MGGHIKGLVVLVAASVAAVVGVGEPAASANPPRPTIAGPAAAAYGEVVALSGRTPEPSERVTAFTKSTTARHFHIWRSTRSGGAGQFDFTYRARHGVDYYVLVGGLRSRVGTTLVAATITGPASATCGTRVVLSGTSVLPRQRVTIYMKGAHSPHFVSRRSLRSNDDATFQLKYPAEHTFDYYAYVKNQPPSRVGTTRTGVCD